MLIFEGHRVDTTRAGVVLMREGGARFSVAEPLVMEGADPFRWTDFSKGGRDLAAALIFATLIERPGMSASRARAVGDAFAADFFWSVLANIADNDWTMTGHEVGIALSSVAGKPLEEIHAQAP